MCNAAFPPKNGRYFSTLPSCCGLTLVLEAEEQYCNCQEMTLHGAKPVLFLWLVRLTSSKAVKLDFRGILASEKEQNCVLKIG